MTSAHVRIHGYMVTDVLMCAIGLENASSDELLCGHHHIAHQLCPHFQANLNIHMHVCIGRVALWLCPVPLPPCAHISTSCTLLMELPIPLVP